MEHSREGGGVKSQTQQTTATESACRRLLLGVGKHSYRVRQTDRKDPEQSRAGLRKLRSFLSLMSGGS